MINCCFTDHDVNTESQQQRLVVGSFIAVDILTIIELVAIIEKLHVASSTTVPNRLSRIIGRMAIFIYSLELLIMVLVLCGLLLPLSSASSSIGSLIPFFQLCFVLSCILAIISSLLICYNFCCCCSSTKKEYEIGDYKYEDIEMRDEEENPENEVHYYDDLVAVNNDGTMDREQQQQQLKQK